MGKTTEQLDALTAMLNGVPASDVSVDEPTPEIKKRGRPKKEPKIIKTWAGVDTPEVIYNACEHIKTLLIEQERYTQSMDYQIFNSAVQYWLYNDLVTKMISGDEIVAVRALTTTSEALRRSLQSLGLTVTDKKSGITKSEAEPNPLLDLVGSLSSSNESDGEVIIKKKS